MLCKNAGKLVSHARLPESIRLWQHIGHGVLCCMVYHADLLHGVSCCQHVVLHGVSCCMLTVPCCMVSHADARCLVLHVDADNEIIQYGIAIHIHLQSTVILFIYSNYYFFIMNYFVVKLKRANMVGVRESCKVSHAIRSKLKLNFL